MTAVSAPATGGSRPKTNAATIGSDIRSGFHARWASLEAEGTSEPSLQEERAGQVESWSPRASFSERFLVDQTGAPSGSSQISTSFDDRFGGEFTASVATARSAAATQRSTVQHVATASATRTAPRTIVAQGAPKRAQETRSPAGECVCHVSPSCICATHSVKGSKPVAERDVEVAPRSMTSHLKRCICRTDGGWKPILASATTWTIRAM